MQSARVQGATSGASTRAISGVSRPNVTLTYGLRVDAPQFPDKPTANPVAVANFGYATDVVPNDVQWSPRVGFNWALNGTNTAQFRGGVGLFTGRPAYVWISNQFGNTGIDFTRIGAATTPTTAFRSSPIRSTSRRP